MDKGEILGVILAGGESRRMGSLDKAEIILAGKRLIDHVVERLVPQVRSVIVSGKTDYGLGFVIVPDLPGAGRGPLYGLQAALKWAKTGAPWVKAVLTVPVDGPFFPHNLAQRLAQNPPSLVSVAGKIQPTFGLWPVRPGFDLDAWIENEQNPSIKTLAKRLGVRAVPFPESDSFANINSRADLAKITPARG